MRDAKLAKHLALTLSDAEFELMLRYRCERMSNELLVRSPEYDASHNYFVYRWGPERNDNGWRASVGINYNKTEVAEGEVLSKCIDNENAALNARFANKISALLSAPEPELIPHDSAEVPF